MKKLLNDNKVYFETVGAVVPALVALVISVWSLNVAMRARDISYEQISIERSQSRPIFQAEMKPILSDQLSVLGSSVEIANYGQPARDLSMNVYEFLEVECGLEGKGVWNEIMPIRDYYKYTYLTGDPTGTVAKLVPEENYQKFGDLYSRSLVLDPGYATPKFSSLVVLSYWSTADEEVVEYLVATPHGICYRIDDKAGRALIDLHQEAEAKSDGLLCFTSITAEILRDRCGLPPAANEWSA